MINLKGLIIIFGLIFLLFGMYDKNIYSFFGGMFLMIYGGLVDEQ